mmetsp:Transcript_1742/g.5146  ORF Transcript_1742/g.5146 Transcript_1742/m.5146 type:complete len:229 (+) Transcript_1742:448-1134(+)
MQVCSHNFMRLLARFRRILLLGEGVIHLLCNLATLVQPCILLVELPLQQALMQHVSPTNKSKSNQELGIAKHGTLKESLLAFDQSIRKPTVALLEEVALGLQRINVVGKIRHLRAWIQLRCRLHARRLASTDKARCMQTTGSTTHRWAVWRRLMWGGGKTTAAPGDGRAANRPRTMDQWTPRRRNKPQCDLNTVRHQPHMRPKCRCHVTAVFAGALATQMAYGLRLPP